MGGTVFAGCILGGNAEKYAKVAEGCGFMMERLSQIKEEKGIMPAQAIEPFYLN